MADAAYIAITPNAPINESVFTPGSYVVQNFSTGGVQITSVSFDISTALFPGLVFDPSPTGSSGNELGKPFTVDENIGGITASSAVTNAYQGEIGQLLTVTTGSFDPSDRLAFSIDIDPGRVTTSDPAAGPQGKMIGLELIGSTVTVTFSDGTTRTGEVFTDGSVGGAEILIDDGLLTAPTVTVAGTAGGVGTLSGPMAQVSVSGGPANGLVRLVVVRGIDELLEPTTNPYEAHRATDMRYIDVQLGADGAASLSLDLSAGGSWALGGGIFHVTGAVIDGQGDAQSLVSDISRLRVATDADLDTDGDGLINGKDRFALDATNGGNKNLAELGSITLDFGSGSTPFETGFTGVMSNGQESHTQLGVSGTVAGGVLTLQTTGGDANGALNTQKNGYQFGVDTSGVQTFTVETKVFNPFLGGVAVENYRQAGLQIGAGNQDDYAKLVFHSNNGAGGIEFMTEMGFVPSGLTSALGVPLQNVAYAMLYLDVAKTASGGTITPRWTLHDAGGAQIGAGSQAPKAVTGSLLDAIQGDLTTQGLQSELAVGVISTSFGSSGPVSASWDHLKISTAAAPPAQAIAVNVGGPAVTTGGVSYLADQYFTGGATFSVTSAIAGTTDDAVYQTERYGSTFSYAVPVANGSYSVTLKFAELYYNAAGQRVFDVSAEGALVLDNLDIFASAGGKFIAKDFVVP
ncbi:malectin, partial [Phenylobacterium sp.]|uniref:malectin n=1 Tax=Phenylobacterium sp. TaxID=1871053 RepID=UPI002BB0078A